MFEEKHPSLIYSAFPPLLFHIPSISSTSPSLTALFYLLYPSPCTQEFSPVPLPPVLSSSSQLVSCAPVLQFRLQHVRVLGLKAQLPLLLSLP